MRWLVLIPWIFAACGNDPAPPPIASPAATTSPTSPTVEPTAPAAHADLGQIAERLLQGNANAQDRSSANADPAAATLAILQAASKASPIEQGRAPAALCALGAAALPHLASALSNADTGQRRIAALTLLQLGTSLHENGSAGVVLAALAAARNDADLSVRAAAELAYQRATGDTSAIDASRAAHEAAERAGR
jgi:hypothetical protein